MFRYAVGAGLAGAGIFYVLPQDAKFYLHAPAADFATSMLRNLDAETAHNLAIQAARYGLTPSAPPASPILYTECFGLGFESPVGLAAGFDKNAEAVDGLLALGFGFVEVGTATPLPQPGNEKPRMWRLEEDQGVINRYGFNNQGINEVDRNLKGVVTRQKPVGVNVGKNKLTPEEESTSDYEKGIRKLGPRADYLVINVSSPNTPGLRNLQKREVLQKLLMELVKVRRELPRHPPLLVKVAPDLSPEELKDVAEAALQAKVDGIIVSNTTVSRPASLKSANKQQLGGLSGRPLRALSTQAVYDMSIATNGNLPIIGVGGIGSGQDAFDKLVAGASLVQIYSMMAYEGPSLPHRVNEELAELLVKHGFSSVKEAVGAAHRNPGLLPRDLKADSA